MASFTIQSLLLLFPMLMGTYYSVPDSYGFSGTLGAGSHLNVTGRGYGTLKQKGVGVSGDADGFLGAKWNGTAFSGGVVNYNDLYIGGTGSVNKVVEGALKPGATFETGLGGNKIVPRLSAEKDSKTTYDTKFVFGDDAKRLANSYGADVYVNSANGSPCISIVCVMFYIFGVFTTMKLGM